MKSYKREIYLDIINHIDANHIDDNLKINREYSILTLSNSIGVILIKLYNHGIDYLV